MSSVSQIRSTFIDFFRKNGHEPVASSPLVPDNDPTLLFTNAGMVQFKNVFTGLESRPYNRAVTSQKCLRAGGKHNDLDNVGYTARHHTFFEMLGNFSFGDYFKEQAIDLAWHLVTREFGLNEKRLLVTVYSEDDEAHSLWKKIAGLSDDKIIRIPTSDNFWSMGDTGPCGPCSEIFYDHGEHIPGGPPGSADEDGDRFIEIWNLVFMQFEQMAENERLPLPRPSIDTGMGLERIAAILQGVHDNYDIDLFQKLIAASVELSGIAAEGDALFGHRIIADHLRACSFLVADGVMPSNEGRGYVLRRILRRAMRHAHLLGTKEPLLSRLVPELARIMGDAFPQIRQRQEMIIDSFKMEEVRFGRTLEKGLSLLEAELEKMPEGNQFDGKIAFQLYDTYGFPLDLTEDVLRGANITVDKEAFDSAMAQQRADARAAWAGSGDKTADKIWFELSEEIPASEFMGYNHDQVEGEIKAIVAGKERIPTLQAGEEAGLIVNQTCFYAQAGGQLGDTGIISSEEFEFQVTDTRKHGQGLIVHFGKLTRGQLREGDVASLRINNARRTALRRHHSATHLLHAGLREMLGDHVGQKGSLVAPDRLRFDFSHQSPVKNDELREITQKVNQIVFENTPVETQIMAIDDAMTSGAMALFGEKYGDEVRVVSMGKSDNGNTNFSVELCGGTHVKRTGDIGSVIIISENAVSSGVRRIEALAGQAALEYLGERDRLVHSVAGQLKTVPEEISAKIETLMSEHRKLEQTVSELRKKIATGGSNTNSAQTIEQISGIHVRLEQFEDIAPRELKGMVDEAKTSLGSGIIAYITIDADKKAAIVVGVTDDLTARFNAIELVRLAADILGGKGGGGRPDLAQAGGHEGNKAQDALAAIRQKIEEQA